MKILFIEAKKKSNLGLKVIDKKLPKKLCLLYTIQYENIAGKIKKQLEKKGYEILVFKQILGCSKLKLKADALLIGSGMFHALRLALSTEKDIFLYQHGKIIHLSEEEIKKLKRIEKAKLSNFFASDKIGLLVSLKPGQNKLKEAIKFKHKVENKFKDKKFYIIISDTINLQELENFPFQFFINFACPGIELDSARIINYEKISKNKKIETVL